MTFLVIFNINLPRRVQHPRAAARRAAAHSQLLGEPEEHPGRQREGPGRVASQ